MLTDSHAHLTFPDFAGEIPAVLERARVAGVQRIITIGTSVESSREAVELAERFENVFAVVGIHPGSADEAPDDFLPALRALAAHPKVVAIGETGLDYHYLPSLEADPKRRLELEALGNETTRDLELSIADGAYKSRQAEVFQQQLELAAGLGLNVVIHQRDSWDDTVELLMPYSDRLSAVFHCFGESPARSQQLMEMGHLVSFTGIVTFKNGELVRQSAASVPLDRFMVETDCPYLAPVPDRGKRCEPAHTRLVAEEVARVRGISLEEVAAATEATAAKFFRFS